MLVYKVENQLQSAETIINNVLNNPSLLKKLEGSKFDFKQFVYGKELLDKVLMLQAKQELASEEHKEFSQTLDIDRKQTYQVYVKHKKIALLALRDKPDLSQSLKLNGDKTYTVDGWLEQAYVFYKNVKYISKDMEAERVDKAELIQVKVMIEALLDAKNTKLRLRKSAQEATILRDKALNQLQQWLYKFQTIAQISLQNDLPTLAALGMELES